MAQPNLDSHNTLGVWIRLCHTVYALPTHFSPFSPPSSPEKQIGAIDLVHIMFWISENIRFSIIDAKNLARHGFYVKTK